MAKTGKPSWMKTTPEWAPLRLAGTRATPVETFVLFSIDDKDYAAPVEVSGAVALSVMQVMADRGIGPAIVKLLRSTIGQENLDALSECPELSREQLGSIITHVQERYLSQISEVAGGN